MFGLHFPWLPVVMWGTQIPWESPASHTTSHASTGIQTQSSKHNYPHAAIQTHPSKHRCPNTTETCCHAIPPPVLSLTYIGGLTFLTVIGTSSEPHRAPNLGSIGVRKIHVARQAPLLRDTTSPRSQTTHTAGVSGARSRTTMLKRSLSRSLQMGRTPRP